MVGDRLRQSVRGHAEHLDEAGDGVPHDLVDEAQRAHRIACHLPPRVRHADADVPRLVAQHEALAREDPGEVAEPVEHGRRELGAHPRDDSLADQVVRDPSPRYASGVGSAARASIHPSSVA